MCTCVSISTCDVLVLPLVERCRRCCCPPHAAPRRPPHTPEQAHPPTPDTAHTTHQIIHCITRVSTSTPPHCPLLSIAPGCLSRRWGEGLTSRVCSLPSTLMGMRNVTRRPSADSYTPVQHTRTTTLRTCQGGTLFSPGALPEKVQDFDIICTLVKEHQWELDVQLL
jgi:hypothetical protein